MCSLQHLAFREVLTSASYSCVGSEFRARLAGLPEEHMFLSSFLVFCFFFFAGGVIKGYLLILVALLPQRISHDRRNHPLKTAPCENTWSVTPLPPLLPHLAHKRVGIAFLVNCLCLNVAGNFGHCFEIAGKRM